MRTALLFTVVAVAVPVSSASAGTQLTFPAANAACPAQAFVPANTDPTEPAIGPFLSVYFRGATPGEFSQRNCNKGG